MPFRECVPRSEKRIPEPATRSLTVRETSTSPAAACALELGLGTGAGEELLHLAMPFADALVPRVVVVTFELDQPCIGQVLRQPAPMADVDQPVAAAMQHERRRADARDDVTHIDVH